MFGISPLRTILRFEQQNKNWNLQDLQKHSSAFASGLQSLSETGRSANQKGNYLFLNLFIQRNILISLIQANILFTINITIHKYQYYRYTSQNTVNERTTYSNI